MSPLPFCPMSINVDFVIFMQFLAILFKILTPFQKANLFGKPYSLSPQPLETKGR